MMAIKPLAKDIIKGYFKEPVGSFRTMEKAMSYDPYRDRGQAAPVGTVSHIRDPRFDGDGAGVSFAQAVKRGLWKSTIYGRASRAEFWYFWLFCTILDFCSLIVINGIFDLENIDHGVNTLLSIILLPVFVRRLHDVNRSGWWVWIAFTVVGLIPLFIWSVKKGDRHRNRFDEVDLL